MKRKKHSETPKAKQPLSEPIARRELVLLAAILTIGASLRIATVATSAVEHFDEGVYASNIYFGPPDYSYPMLRFYAPPLLPALIEGGMIASLPPNLAALLPSFLAGCGTIVALWLFGRSWFNPRVGLAAASLAALSNFHVAYSAAALTDVLLGLWMVLAIDAMARSLARDDLRWAVAAGLFTGAAWWTKYNGWLPLAIETTALPILWFLVRKRRSESSVQSGSPARWLVSLCTTAIIAFLVWTPYLLSLRDEGGYAPIAANHAKYVVGVGGWVNSASRQTINFSVIDHRWSAIALAAAVLAGALFVVRDWWSILPARRIHWPLVAASTFILLASFTHGLIWLAIMSLTGVALALWRVSQTSHRIGIAIVSAWWLGLFLSTPCYSPYSRLLIPWLLAAWLGVGILLDEVIWQPIVAVSTDARRSRVGVQLLGGLAVLVLILSLLPVAAGGQITPAQKSLIARDRLGLKHIAAQLHRDLDTATTVNKGASASDAVRVVYVFGEPSIFFQLSATGETVVSPVQQVISSSASREGRDLPTFLVVGPHSQRDPNFLKQWAAEESHWKLLREYSYSPSAIVWLDLHDPREPASAGEFETHNIRLYQFQP
jgi:4-amino-4-deoxy-L-arabinose transferase-like glycosyltransferase